MLVLPPVSQDSVFSNFFGALESKGGKNGLPKV